MFNIPLDLANAIYNTANVVLILGAILVAGGTLTAIWTGGIKDRFADERISQNENEAAQARLETERLRQQMAWRRLSEDQIKKIASELASLTISLRMTVIANDPESILFASDIRHALLSAGIEISVTTTAVSGAAVVGIIIKGPKDDAIRIGNAFVAAGLNVQVKEQGGDLQILVGSKPPPQ